MKAFKIAFVIIGLTAGTTFASDFSFTGNLNNNNEVQPFFFTVAEPTTITLQTFSYDGGTNAAGTAIPGGGFDPILSLFDAISGRLLVQNDDGFGLDSFLGVDLNAGNYFATLTKFGSFPAGQLLSEGFLGSGGGSTDLHWAVDILNASSASMGVPYISPIPEPGTYAMFLAGLGLLGWRMHRSAVLQSNRQGLLEA